MLSTGSNLRSNFFRLTLLVTLAALACKALPFFGSDPEVTFAVVGDVMGHEAQIRSAYDPATKTYKYDSVFNRLGNRISAADLGIANLEVTLPGKPEMYSGYPQFGSPDSLVTALKDIGFDLLVTANNHSMDKGEAAALRTVKVVRDAGFLQTGTFDPRDYAERRILIVEKNEIRMAFLNYTYDTNGIAVTPGIIVNVIEKERIQKDFELARAAKPDVIIVLYHFGKEYLSAPDAYQKEWVEFAFQEGAQIVLGGHPHTLQPFERKITRDRFGVEAERFVIYSLGNFVSNMQRRQVDGGIILNFAIQKKDERIVIRKINYEPLWVYTPIIKGKMEFYLLPVMEYLDSKELDPNSMARMKQFLSDTQALLKQSMESTRDPAK
ncbi:MAG: CapA family protein [Leptospirales bacterium]|nr:CapA family protein [Leptospirales bacterium]